MSRYVSHPHGLVIGSDNMFVVIDRLVDSYEGEPPLVLPEGVSDFRDGYMATVSFDRYKLDRASTINVGIRTPADQLVWVEDSLEWTRQWGHDGKVMDLPMRKTYFVLSGFMERWLNENVGARYEQWDTYTRSTTTNRGLFFKKRKDALAFVKMVALHLSGINEKL